MRPLEDLRILAIEQYGAGPFGSQQLADLGADIIRIETVDGDIARGVPPFAEGGDSLFYESFNRNKRGIVLDLEHPDGRAVFEELVAVADAVYSNLRGDVVRKLRLRYEDLAHLNPRIVCCSLSGFGMTGPRAAEPAFDYMVQGMTGWMSLTGEPDGPPEKSGLSMVDFSAGIAAAGSLLAGVHAARRDGVGCDCDVSLFDTAMSMLNYVGTWQASAGYSAERQPHSAHPTMTPFQAFPTADGWIVAGGTKEKFWRAMAVAIDRADLAQDPRFADFDARRRNRDAFVAALEETFRTRTSAEWIERLTVAGVPCSRVNSVAEALAEPHALARGSVIETEHPRFGTVRTLASALRAGPPQAEHRRAPQLAEHTVEVLHDLLGYDDDRIERLAGSGAIGISPTPR
jgi:crotonobetainyl-CoA:carnitine CoA-transferase CaiB-like acyl-CoA transferase